MIRAKKEKEMADSFYQSFLEKQSLYTDSMFLQNYGRGKRRFFESPLENLSHDYILDFDYKQFVVGKQLQVFPFLTDGGFQTSRYNTYSSLELFNSKFKDECPSVRLKSHRPVQVRGRAPGSPYEHVFRQYIS